MKVKYEFFRSSYQSWDTLFIEASQFASLLGKDRLISVSHSCDHKREGVVTVWYWDNK